MKEDVTGYAGENVFDETTILLKGVPCEVYEYCDVLAFTVEGG
jgi:hypothetical protein